MQETDGYCRECRTKHGPWGHLPPQEARTMQERMIYVVVRQADVGSIELTAAATDYAVAERLADDQNQADGRAYSSWVEELVLTDESMSTERTG